VGIGRGFWHGGAWMRRWGRFSPLFCGFLSARGRVGTELSCRFCVSYVGKMMNWGLRNRYGGGIPEARSIQGACRCGSARA